VVVVVMVLAVTMMVVLVVVRNRCSRVEDVVSGAVVVKGYHGGCYGRACHNQRYSPQFLIHPSPFNVNPLLLCLNPGALPITNTLSAFLRLPV
jgi:hypothetical protein